MDMEGAISVDNNYLERLFPAFLEIGDQELRERSERAMAMAMEQGQPGRCAGDPELEGVRCGLDRARDRRDPDVHPGV